MARDGLRRPASGIGARRGAAWRRAAGLVAAALLAAANPVTAQRIAYPSLQRDDQVLSHAAPHIAYPGLPVDARIAPDDFTFDEDETDPAELRRAADRALLSQLSQNYRPSPAIWRIGVRHATGRDSTIYLFGTVHVLPPGFRWRSAAVDRVVAEANTLIVEAVDDGAAVPPPGGARRGVPLIERVAPDHRAAVTRFTDGLPAAATAQLETMPTWMVAIAVGFVRDLQAGETPGPGADDWLEERFRAAGKPVLPIEEGGAVMARIGAIPERDQRRMLAAALDARQPTRAERRAPTHAWARGELGPGSPLTLDLGGSSGSESLNRALLIERNRAWAVSLKRLLARPGTMLFAAGAGHFIGPDSVLVLLKKDGVRVTRVR